MKIIFMGTPDYAQKILEEILKQKNMEVVAVYTQPDKPVGRKKVLTAPPVKVTAQEHNLKIYQPDRLRDEDVVNELLKIECDFIVVAAYGQILPKAILDHAPSINLHASILPKYRGASPIQQAILNADKTTGVTAMLMDEGLDTGDILKIQEIDIADDEMVESLFNRLTKVAATLTIDVSNNYESLTPIKQDESKATHCIKITKANGEVFFDDAFELFNKYRAYTPWPGIYLKSGLKLKKIALIDKDSKNRPGEILEIKKDSIVVGCSSGLIEIFNVQAPSKKEVDIISYINGKRLKIEDTLS